MKNAVFWDVTPCSLQPPAHAGSSLVNFLPWRWRRYVPPKRRFTQDLHGTTSQKTAFFLIKIRGETLYWIECIPRKDVLGRVAQFKPIFAESKLWQHFIGETVGTDGLWMQEAQLTLLPASFTHYTVSPGLSYMQIVFWVGHLRHSLQ
jgi:hypothetical protein